MFDACTSAEDHAPPAETRAERRLRRLSRMADIGLAIAEKLERQAELAAVHAEVDAVPDNLPHSRRLDEIGRTFAQVSRAVSLATALEDRIDQGLPAIPDGDRPVQERAAKAKRAEVARAVVHAIEVGPKAYSRRRVVDLRVSLGRLLDAEMADLQGFLRRPFEEIEARLRRELGLAAEGEGASGCAGVAPTSSPASITAPPGARGPWFNELPGPRASRPRRGLEARAPGAAARTPSGASP